ncbi:MAG TPA: type II secretion system secretin GspD [Methylococcus sp.]|nr:type II secretion system secretin GspD [Methylococcus sp.]
MHKAILRLTLLATVFGTGGCASLLPQFFRKPEVPTNLKVEKVTKEEPPSGPLEAAKTEMLKEPEYYPPKGAVVNPAPGRLGEVAGGRRASRKEGKYTLNFDDADLAEVAKVILGDTLKLNYVLSPKVSGRVSLQTTRPLTEDEMLPTLETLLRMNGAVLIRDKGIYRIEPDANALIGAPGAGVGTGPLEPGFQLRVVPLRYVSAEEMKKVLEPVMPPKAVLRVDEVRNLVMVAGTAEELASVMDTIDIFDVDYMRGMSVALFPLKNVDAKTIAEELTKLLDTGAKGRLEGMVRILPIERLSAILAVSPQMRYLEEVESWVERLDRYNTTRVGNTHVYRCQHVDAMELAHVLGGIFGTGRAGPAGPSLAPGLTGMEIGGGTSTGFGTVSGLGTTGSSGYGGTGTSSGTLGGIGSTGSTGFGGTGGTLGGGTSGVTGGLGRAGTGMGGVSGGVAGGIGGRRPLTGAAGAAVTELAGGARVVADPSNNALIVVAKPQEWKEIEAVIKELDMLPMQVLIDATIVEVLLRGELKYGLQWVINGTGGGSNKFALLGPIGRNLAAAVSGGFSYAAILNGGNVRVLLDLLARQNLLNILSSPSLMVLNNQEARINVGDQVPIITGTVQSVGGVIGGATSQFQYQQSGVTLQLRPRVNAGGLVTMEVLQAISTPSPITVGQDQRTFQFANREIKSSIAVPNGDTIVLGGLIQDRRREEQTGFPYLNQLPLIGWLFGQTSITPERNELVILITPRVVEKKRDITGISNEYRQKLKGLYGGGWGGSYGGDGQSGGMSLP